MYERLIDSPVGLLTLRAEDGALTAILFGDQRTGLPGSDQILDQAEAELKEYFAGERKEFAVPVRLMGTEFQKKVWAALAEIPYGETRSYSELAAAAGSPKAARAAGMACHSNPIPIFIPCHRVVGKSGKLTGYAGGLELKAALLKLEGVIP